MRRITSFLLALVLLSGFAVLFAPPASATTAMKTSDAMLAVMKKDEGFTKYPEWDYMQYTIGYGSKCPDDMLEYYQKNGITEAEAELLLRNYLTNTEYAVNKYMIEKQGLQLTQGQFDALVSFSYNMGTAWMRDTSSNIFKQVTSGAVGNELIDALTRWCKAGGKILSGLVRRRLSEANMYLNGQYSQKPPETFCYVIYNGNGGSTSQSIQGYDSSLTALPYCVATYENFTFDGWYTAAVGGTKVTKLDASTHKLTLYAHWKEIHTADPDETEDPVEVTVTVDALNLRKGPGTNYAIVGSASKGDKLSILQTLTVSGALWGQYDGGWTCLTYTDYEEVIAAKSESGEQNGSAEPETTEPETTEPEVTEPETTESETTEPEVTEPETTESETTEPEVTEPETTEPETTAPEVTEPETTAPQPTEPPTSVPQPTEPETTAPAEKNGVMGTVTSNDVLNVRSGPGTAYSVVKTLKPKARVEILEQKTVGSMIWGKTPDGWVSMQYITLDVQEDTVVTPPDNSSDTQTTTSVTGTVTCNSLNIRTGPGVSYSYAGAYGKGASVTITETKTVGSTTWGKTSKGWVSMAYIKVTSTSTTTTPSDTTQTGTVNSNDVLNVRSGPGTSYVVVAYLNPKTTVTITETKTVGSTTWGKTSKGWVSMDYIKLNAATNTDSTENGGNGSAANNTATSRTGTVKVDGFLNVRSGAGTGYSIKGYYYNGDKITVTETKTVGSVEWGKTEKGWISMEYVVLDPLKDENGNTIYVVEKTVNTSMLNIRSGAGTGYDIVGYLYKGAKVEITEIKIVKDTAWGKISQGWVSMAYLV